MADPMDNIWLQEELKNTNILFIDRLRLRIVIALMPWDYRLVNVMGSEKMPLPVEILANDLVSAGDAMARNWGCSPDICYNAAEYLREIRNEDPQND